MVNRKTKFVMAAVLFASIGISTSINTVSVSADATVKPKQGVVVRSTSLSTSKTIKVPDRTAQKKAEEEKKKTVTRPSRGSEGFSGGSTVAVGNRGSVVAYASKFLGVPYVWGASSPRAFDCSGFTSYVYSAFGVSLPHYTGSQASMGQAVSRNSLVPGDLVFFNTYGPISHVGIYIGDGQFIHASSGSGKVTVSDLSENYYASRYAGARRMIQQ